ncbi:class C sortase [Clostridium intestinale]|uniref:Sortase family protein n=1 Tax=Clostridium intestinale DSM 6191 TaxID=1121320 RepID=A0A1M5ZE05_9CLOT|nr:class C sortase [Clostridium intestinale]SHI22399.1 Sortase family protein [Clostridium intestinale DSM 6191]
MKFNKLLGKKRYIFIFILGMIVFLYPTLSNLYYNYTAVSNTYMEYSLNNQTSKNEDLKDAPKAEPYLENNDDTIFAYINIDKIHQTLPIYLDVTEEHLSNGVAVIKGTSIPVGGENTNSVIAGHTGQVKKLFTDLPELEPGDEITITNKIETLYYKVTGNKLIMPDQEEYLSIIEGKDMITLLTCYHGTLANDRLLVFAERYNPGNKTDSIKASIINQDKYSYLSKVELEEKPIHKMVDPVVIACAIILIILFVYTFSKKKDNSK